MKTWNVTENNGGGITLNIWDDNVELIYIHSGYEYNVGQLSDDIRALYADDNNLIDPSTWDGNEIDDDDVDYDDRPSTKIIAEGDENGYKLHIELRGHGSRKEFCE